MGFVPRGIIPPIITPLTDDGEVNYPVLRQMVNHLIDNGVHGLFPLGTTGEFYAFDDDTYRKILETVKDETRGRVPVYGGANHITTRGVIRLVKICEEVGVDAVSVLTPMFVSQTQDELYAYYKEIAESTTLPIILYNNKPKTNVTIEPATVAKLAEIDNIVAVKDSTGDMTNAAEYIRLTRDNDNFHVLIFWKEFFFHFFDCNIQYAGYALYCCADSQNISGSCISSIRVCISFKGCYWWFRQICNDVLTIFHVVY